MRTAIVLSHGHAAKWLQVIIHSLKSFTNERKTDIFVAHTWPGHPSIKAITETDLANNVVILDCKIRLQSHATGLDEVLDLLIDYGQYDYMFCAETDAMACCNGWLDWFHQMIGSDPVNAERNKFGKCGMAGFFWHEGNNHYNINPSGTLYLIEMLERYHNEVRKNTSDIFWHPNGNRMGTDGGMDPTIKKVAGVFSETRGIENPSPEQKNQILKGIPQAAWFEPGAWLYYRSLGEYSHIAVPCDHIYTQFGPVTSPEGTYYGGKANPKYIHYWGGTRAYDFLKHPINDHFVSGGAPYWLQREDTIWKAVVPEKYRKIMPQIYEEMNFEEKLRTNLPGWEKVKELVK
uniref:Glycosyltransferase n=1 Tax=viral metagenome TaxID=1070528 RepID=A0A6M3KI67_9ZZZZ